MFDARTTQFIRASPDAILDFIMDIERYAEIDEKIRPVLWIRREENFTEFAFRPKLAGLVGPTLVSQERLTPGRRVDISLAPSPHNRLIRAITHYEASFECVPVPGGTEVTRSERFRLRWPLRWIVGPYLHRKMPILVRRELLLAKQKLEGQVTAVDRHAGNADPSGTGGPGRTRRT
ncbi:MAG TPA: SRPBCC family protein [Micromonosporaceae bacterium]|nr:SRPBCC family protein [Micromonosporaceae bacterium]